MGTVEPPLTLSQPKLANDIVIIVPDSDDSASLSTMHDACLNLDPDLDTDIYQYRRHVHFLGCNIRSGEYWTTPGLDNSRCQVGHQNLLEKATDLCATMGDYNAYDKCLRRIRSNLSYFATRSATSRKQRALCRLCTMLPQFAPNVDAACILTCMTWTARCRE